jgi:hypothetical protein
MALSGQDPFAAGLLKVRSARNRLMVCFLTFPLYVLAVTRLLNNGQEINLLMFAYMGIYAVFGIALTVTRCPRCHEQFFVKHYFLNPFRRTCSHCGLPYIRQGDDQ